MNIIIKEFYVKFYLIENLDFMDYSVLETLDKCEGSDGITGGLVGPPKFPIWVWLLKYV